MKSVQKREPTPNPRPHAELALRLASVLREVQLAASQERTISVSLEVDETIHVAVSELLLTWVVQGLLEAALALAAPRSQLVLGCRSEESGVVVEIDHELDEAALPADAARVARQVRERDWLQLAARAIGGELEVELSEERRIVRLLLPDELRRSYVPPALEG